VPPEAPLTGSHAVAAGKISFASAGNATAGHISGELLERLDRGGWGHRGPIFRGVRGSRTLPGRLSRAGARGAGSFRTRRTRRSCQGSACRRPCWCRSAARSPRATKSRSSQGAGESRRSRSKGLRWPQLAVRLRHLGGGCRRIAAIDRGSCSTHAARYDARLRANRRRLPPSFRQAVSLSGFLTLSQSPDGPERYGALSRFDTTPSNPNLQARWNTIASRWSRHNAAERPQAAGGRLPGCAGRCLGVTLGRLFPAREASAREVIPTIATAVRR
jgi:hypothetical protein